MAIKNRGGYPGFPYCEAHPKYEAKARPVYPCVYCWRIWDDKQKKLVKGLKKQVAEYRAIAQINVDAVRALARVLKEEDL